MKKVAILFGNDKYPAGELKNAANDAQALASKLSELGFDCNHFTDVDIKTMDEKILEFQSILAESEVGLFFFAGHGIQCKGENYLAAIDTSFVDELSCKYSSIALNYVIDVFEESKANTKIIILDACRNNPFEGMWRGASNTGLAPVYAPKGTIIAYATSPGQKAADGIGDNGVYTSALLSHIGTKRLTIEDMFKRVRNTVSSVTQNKQITWEHTSLMGNFFFNSGFDDGKYSAAYSKTAIADGEFTFESESDLQHIIKSLKSSNWYIQNPAITQLSGVDLSHAEIDELFILGRNIYQAACGSAHYAVNWIENLESKLNMFPENLAFHILNGILFEIYFNSHGTLREHFKTLLYEHPIKLCSKEKYINSCNFIRKYLEQYSQRIIYLPGSEEIMTTNIVVNYDHVNNVHYIDKIYIDGLDCMYYDGELYEYDNSYDINVAKTVFENRLIESLVIPKNKINITYTIQLADTDEVVFPLNFKLLRYKS